MKKILFTISIALFFIYAGNAQNAININEEAQVDFQEIDTTSINDNELKASKRLREIALNQKVKSDIQIRLTDILELDLFRDKHYKASVDKIETNLMGTFLIRAKLIGFDNAYCFISTFEGKSFLTIEVPENDELYVTKYNSKANKYFLMEVDKKKMKALEGDPSLIPPPEKQDENNNPQKDLNEGRAGQSDPKSNVQDINNSFDVATAADPTIVTVLIVYTPAAASWATGEGGINNTINSLMAKANLSLENSNTSLQFQLVHSEQVNYTELNNSNDLYNLTYNNDGKMDNVHTLRNTYGADVVVLLEYISYTGGQGWLLSTTSGSPNYAFSLTRVQQASWTYTTVHEIGHNMGCHHHKDQNYQPGPGLFNYSAGWRWIGTNNGKYCSIMTYESGTYFDDGFTHTRVPYFSDPDILYQGVATGDAIDGNNARTLREIKAVVAAYRNDPACIPPTQQATAFITSSIANNSMTVGWTRGNGSNILVVARQGSAVTSSPTSGNSYTANPLFGSGSQIGTGNYVVYSGTGNSVNVTGLSSGTSYHFAIYEYNSANYCYLTPALAGNAVTIPANPVANSATGITKSEFTANWNASSGATGYFLDVATDPAFNNFVSGFENKNVGYVTSSVVSGLEANTTYYYRVRAFNSSGTSGNSDVISATTLLTTIPDAPVANSATNIGTDNFTANWEASAGATGYYLDVATNLAFDNLVSGYTKNVGNFTSYLVTGLTPNSTYYYRLRAYNTHGPSGYSGTISVVTQQVSIPAAPVATSATNIGKNNFSANWEESSGATGYRLDISTSNRFKNFVSVFNDYDVHNVTTFMVSGLSENTTYYYRVRAYNTAGSSSNSNRITTKTLAAIAAPVATEATYITGSSFVANWDELIGATGYYLDVSTSNRFTSFVSGYNNLYVENVLQFTVSGLSPKKTYYYRVRATNGSDVSSNSNVIKCVTPSSLKSAEIAFWGTSDALPSKLIAYPNPFRENINLEYSLMEDNMTSLEVFEISGRVVKTIIKENKKAGTYLCTWDAKRDDHSIVSPGIYFIKLRSGNYTNTKKLVFLGNSK